MTTFPDANRANWDERADIHMEDATGFYGVERFLAGDDVLCPTEAAEIGDILGLKVLHLQCHFGLDSLCLARRGGIVTGLDFSPVAIGHARRLGERSGISARFVEGDVYDAQTLVGDDFDLVYTSWGTINWLPDLDRWGAVVAGALKPGGRFYFVDGHPGLAILEQANGKLEATFDYRTPPSKPLVFDESRTYTGDPRPLKHTRNYEWLHPISDILMALIGNGMVVQRFVEHQTLPWPMFSMMVQGEDRMWRLPSSVPALPLSLSIHAVKAG